MGVEESLRSVAFPLVRFASFSANALLFGILAVLVLVLRPVFSSLPQDQWTRARARVAARLEGMVQAALTAAAAATLLGLLLQSVLASEVAGGELGSASLARVLETGFGRWYAIRVPLLAALAFLLVNRVRERALAGLDDEGKTWGAWWLLWSVLSVALLMTVSTSGHAAVATPAVLAVANDVVHLCAGGCWFSGIVVLSVVLPDAWAGHSDEERIRILAPSVVRFSRVALISIVIVAATGILNAFLHVARLDDLIDTSYGLTLTGKLVLFAGVLGLGGVNHLFVRRRLERALAGEGGRGTERLFRKTIAVELVVGLLLLAVTGLLVGLSRTRQNVDPQSLPGVRPPVTWQGRL